MQEGYRTLRGCLNGEERDEETYFASSATLRIFGDIADLNEISDTLQLQPSRVHRKGEKRCERSAPYKHDMWSYSPPIEEGEPLHHHIDALWSAIRAHREYLLDLKKTVTVDIFLGYRSNCDTAGLEVPHTSLEMFLQLEIPFGVSIIVT
jgi:hypothetical protein